MAVIKNLTLDSFDNGQFKQLYYRANIKVPVGAGNESDVYFVMSRENLKVHTKNASLYETLSTKEEIENDTAEFELVSDGSASIFPLSSGVSFLKIVNNSSTEEAVLSITGV